jgi:hypothetical protein
MRHIVILILLGTSCASDDVDMMQTKVATPGAVLDQAYDELVQRVAEAALQNVEEGMDKIAAARVAAHNVADAAGKIADLSDDEEGGSADRLALKESTAKRVIDLVMSGSNPVRQENATASKMFRDDQNMSSNKSGPNPHNHLFASMSGEKYKKFAGTCISPLAGDDQVDATTYEACLEHCAGHERCFGVTFDLGGPRTGAAASCSLARTADEPVLQQPCNGMDSYVKIVHLPKQFREKPAHPTDSYQQFEGAGRK